MVVGTNRRAIETRVTVRFGKDDRVLLKLLKVRAAAANRSLGDQIKYYARRGAITDGNPTLTWVIENPVLLELGGWLCWWINQPSRYRPTRDDMEDAVRLMGQVYDLVVAPGQK